MSNTPALIAKIYEINNNQDPSLRPASASLPRPRPVVPTPPPAAAGKRRRDGTPSSASSQTGSGEQEDEEEDEGRPARNKRPRREPPAHPVTTLVPIGGVFGVGGAPVADEGHLSAHGARSALKYVNWCVASGRRQRTRPCFLCTFVKHHFTMELSRGADQALFSAVTYGYDLLLSHYDEHHNDDPGELAADLATIYDKHIRGPILANQGGHGPLDPAVATMYPEQTAADFLTHIELHNQDPEYLAKQNLMLVQNVVRFFSTDAALHDAEGRPNTNTGKLLLQAAGVMDKLLTPARQKNATTGSKTRMMRIDPNRAFSVASTRPLEAFQRQAMDALGGATATNTDNVVESNAAQRPNMGEVVSDDDDEDNGSAGGGDDEAEVEEEEEAAEPERQEEEGDAIDAFLREARERLLSEEEEEEEEEDDDVS